MTKSPIAQNPIDLTVSLSAISATPMRGKFLADAGARKTLAEDLDLISLDKFQCHYQLKPLGKNRVKLEATLIAELQQLSAISLEPVTNTIDDNFETEFWPIAQQGSDEAAELDIEYDDRIVEYYIDDKLNIGQVIYEHFVITIEQFPRAEGETLEWPDNTEDTSDGDNPFAALKALKNK